MFRTFLLSFMLLICLSGMSQITQHIVRPSDTDPAITGVDTFHLAYLDNSATKLNKLLLFFPGSGARPANYTLFMKTAATMGYHVIGLSYENLVKINGPQLCLMKMDTTCHRRARFEIWFGQDQHDSIDISFSNCVINRLRKLLQYLDTNHPTEGWDQFLRFGSLIEWSRIVTAGHSQGGGHAGFGSKYFQIDKAIMIAHTDWVSGRTADWITTPGPTPDSAYFGFIHTQDNPVYPPIFQTWTDWGMFQFGILTSVDTSSPPYANTHTLETSIAPRVAGAYHGAPVVDSETPLNGLGKPVYRPVWVYLLSNTAASPKSNANGNLTDGQTAVSAWPNPTFGSINVLWYQEGQSQTEQSAQYELHSIQGRLLQKGSLEKAGTSFSLDLSAYAAGTYFLRVMPENGEAKVMRIIRE